MIEIGKIVNTHGLRGDLKVEPWCDGIETFEFLNTVFVGGSKYEISSVKPHKNVFLLKLKDIDTIESAETLKGKVITADEKDMPPLPDGVFYIRDIMGMEVYDGEKHIGQIYDWIETGTNNVYVIKRPSGKDVLIPAVDEVVKEIDVEKKIMSVKMLKGLMEDDD